MEGQVVLVRKQNNYGSEVLYPVNDLAHALCEIAFKRTVSERMVNVIKAHGGIVELAPIEAQIL